MAHKTYRVSLTVEQRTDLEALTRSGTVRVRVYKRARALLLADENLEEGGLADAAIAPQVSLSLPTVQRIRRRFAEAGLEAALYDRPRRGRPARLDGAQKAALTALACSTPPQGYARWSLRLLADRAVELELVDTISHAGVRQVLKKTDSSPT
jgi:transposase